MAYYDINGVTAEELVREMSQKSPRCVDSEGPTPGTSWCVGTTHVPDRAVIRQVVDANCNVVSATVDYTVEVTVPRWKPPPGAQPELVATWNRFLRGVYAFQKGYVDIAVRLMSALPGRVVGRHCPDSKELGNIQDEVILLFDQDCRAYYQATHLGADLVPAFP
jgi:predicted secreted Zn-dependent protease